MKIGIKTVAWYVNLFYIREHDFLGTLLAGAQASNDTKAAAQLTGLAGKPGVFGVIESASSSGGQLSGSSLGGSVGNDGRPTGFYDTVQNVQQVKIGKFWLIYWL